MGNLTSSADPKRPGAQFFLETNRIIN